MTLIGHLRINMANILGFTFLLTICVKRTILTSECDLLFSRESCLIKGKNCAWSSINNVCHDILIQEKTNEHITEIALKVKGYSVGYDPVLAYEYILKSALAYADDPKKCQEKRMPNDDFVLHQGIVVGCADLSLFHNETCYAYTAVSKKRKRILVAFRGTDFQHNKDKQILDQMISVLFYPKKPFMTGGHVQEYFMNAYERLSPCVDESLVQLMTTYPDYNVTITGHSLGAALASLSAAALVYRGYITSDRLSVYQFGDPREGDGQYATSYDKLVPHSWRVVHYRDIVSHLPTCHPIEGCRVTNGWPYHTRTEVYYPHSEMNVTSPYKICDKNEDPSCSDGSITTKWCFRDIRQCIFYHKHYFGIYIGKYCNNVSTTDGYQKLKNHKPDEKECKMVNF